MARKFLASLILFAAFTLSPRAAELNDGLLAYLPLAADFNDASGKKVSVSPRNGVRIAAEGAYFSGGNGDWIALPAFSFKDRPFAIAMWVKVTGKNPMYGLVHQYGATEPNKWLHLMFRGGLQPYMGFYINDAISPLAIQPNQWAHLVFQFEGKHQQLWVNGALLCSRESGAYSGEPNIVTLGRSPNWNNVPSKNFEGFMREVRVYERALSGAEIRQLVGLQEDLKTASDALMTDPLLSNALAAEVGVPFLDIQGNKLLITGESNQIYEIRASSDLNAGFEVIGMATNRSGRIEFIDPVTTGNRFYTVRLHK
jgi:hypothetical protein